MKKLTKDEMKKISGGFSGSGCVDGGFCRFSNQCTNPPPGAIDWFCDTGRRTCVYCF